MTTFLTITAVANSVNHRSANNWQLLTICVRSFVILICDLRLSPAEAGPLDFVSGICPQSQIVNHLRLNFFA